MIYYLWQLFCSFGKWVSPPSTVELVNGKLACSTRHISVCSAFTEIDKVLQVLHILSICTMLHELVEDIKVARDFISWATEWGSEATNRRRIAAMLTCGNSAIQEAVKNSSIWYGLRPRWLFFELLCTPKHEIRRFLHLAGRVRCEY